MANTTTSTKTKEEGRTGQAADMASQAVDKARQAASSVGQTLGSAASTVGQKAEDWTSSAGSGMKSAGETLREKAPHEGMLGSATEAVASCMENTGEYLQREGIGGMLQDAGTLIRNNPIPALCVGIGVGFLLGMTLKR